MLYSINFEHFIYLRPTFTLDSQTCISLDCGRSHRTHWKLRSWSSNQEISVRWLQHYFILLTSAYFFYLLKRNVSWQNKHLLLLTYHEKDGWLLWTGTGWSSHVRSGRQSNVKRTFFKARNSTTMSTNILCFPDLIHLITTCLSQICPEKLQGKYKNAQFLVPTIIWFLKKSILRDEGCF